MRVTRLHSIDPSNKAQPFAVGLFLVLAVPAYTRAGWRPDAPWIIAPMRWTDMTAVLEFWTYRFGGFVVQHVLDEPAWLALMFC